MPTGYTDKIYNGVSFEDFALSCSRNFGALIHMRDNGGNAEITLPETSDYHVKELNTARKRLVELSRTSLDAAAVEAQDAFVKMVEYRTERDLRKAKKKKQLNEMLTHVNDWEPPTKDHVGLKEFMVKQIEETIKFDCSNYSEDEAVLETPQEWLDRSTETACSDIDYHKKHLDDDRERNKNRQTWIVKLFESLGLSSRVESLKKVKF